VNLLVDIGNSRVKWLLHDHVENSFYLSGAMFRDKSDMHALFCEQWGHFDCPDRVLVSNVSGPYIADILDACIEKEWHVEAEYVKTEAFSHGVQNAYSEYSKLGVDRWMAIIAAWQRYRRYEEAICVVDCGTATTIDGISGSGKHLGGFIFPGYTMMQEALLNNTSNINSVRQTIPSVTFSNTTEQGVNSGCYIAILAAIDRVVTSMKNDYGGQLRCIITGGNAEFVIKQLATEMECEPDLVLHGLAVFSGQK